MITAFRGWTFFAISAVALGPPALAQDSSGSCKVRIGAPLAPGLKPITFSAIDHSHFDALLHRFVDCEGLVSYREWKDDAGAMCELRSYLESFSGVDWAMKRGPGSSVEYSVELQGDEGVVARVVKTFTLKPRSDPSLGYEVSIDYRIENATGNVRTPASSGP